MKGSRGCRYAGSQTNLTSANSVLELADQLASAHPDENKAHGGGHNRADENQDIRRGNTAGQGSNQRTDVNDGSNGLLNSSSLKKW